MSETVEGKLPFWAKCGSEGCGHIWVAAYYPMPLYVFADTLRSAVCPLCGDKNPIVCEEGPDGR